MSGAWIYLVWNRTGIGEELPDDGIQLGLARVTPHIGKPAPSKRSIGRRSKIVEAPRLTALQHKDSGHGGPARRCNDCNTYHRYHSVPLQSPSEVTMPCKTILEV